jgi:hypothetical protein
MHTTAPLTLDELRQLARAAPAPCEACAALACPGWESMPGGFDRSALRLVGTLRAATDDEPTLTEYHPSGTHGWSADAPIAPAYFPCNRCDVWQCTACARAFLRYTEYGGYYVDERIRALDAALLSDATPP